MPVATAKMLGSKTTSSGGKPGCSTRRREHRLVHVHVDQLRAVLDLLARHGEAFLVAAGEDHAGEGAGTRDVGPLTHVDEEGIVADVQRLQAREPQFLLGGGWPPRGKVAHRPSEGADV